VNLSQFSVNNRIFGNMITIAVFAAGLFVAFTITRELFPKTEMDIVVISTIYRNASPDEVENHITIPLEEEVRSVDGVDDFISTSSEGISSIVITLDPDEDLNKERVINDISRKVDRLRLPDDVEKPDIMIISGGDEVIHITVSGNVSEERIRDVASDIKARIEAIPGVSKVDKVGWRDPETWIEVDPNKLIDNELSLEQVAGKVAAQNINMPGGKMQSHDKDTILRTVGEFANLDDVRRVVVRSNPDGQLLTIDDIATVRSTYSDDATTFRANGSRAIKLDVRKKLGGDTLTISDAVTDLVHVIRKDITDVDIGIMDFESFVMRRRLKVLVGNGLMGLILVLCALPLVLNFRMALVTALGIPFAFMGTLIVMSAVGMTINMLTMFGMILVIGMLVDDAIIVSENIYRHIENGKSPYQASIDGAKEVMWPVTATILTTIAAFFPMMFLPGILGKFLKWIPVVVIITLAMSLFEALIILPCHVSEFVKAHDKGKSGSGGGRFWAMMHTRYARLIRMVLHHRTIFLVAVFALFISTMFIAKKKMYVDQFPADLIEIFSVNITTPQGTTKDATESLVTQIEQIATDNLEEHELQNVLAFVGMLTDMDGASSTVGSRYATVFVYLTPQASRKRTAQEVIDDLRPLCSKVDGLETIRFVKVQGGPPVGRAIDIKIVGKDFDTLEVISEKMQASLSKYPGVTNIKDDHDLGKDELRIIVDHAEAARLGVDVRSVARTVYSAFEGVVATSLRKAEDEIRVRVKLAEPYRDQVEHLRTLRVLNRQGRLVEVSKVAALKQTRAVSSIFHYKGERAISVTADVENKKKNGKLIGLINTELWDEYSTIGQSYPGCRIARTGEWEENQKMKTAMLKAVAAALLMIYTILAIQFKSFAHPLTVLMSIPFGMIGVIIALILHGKPISLMAMMGMVGMCGVVVNDAIVLVSFINDLRKAGVPPHDAIIQAAETRLRPIILTSVTTVMGLAPVIYGIGGYEPFVAPAAIVLAYGLVFATFLTLLVVPCFYSLGVDLGKKLGMRAPDSTSDEQAA
jgi:multidrug efflux pump subunit AcrB